MRLFYQLPETDQTEAISHCTNIVLEDMIEDGMKVEPITDEDFELKEKLDAAIIHMKDFATPEEKMDYLMNDPIISKAVYDIGLEMAKSAFYHSHDELVIYPEALGNDHMDDDACEDCGHDHSTNKPEKEEKHIPAINTKKSKKPNMVN